MNNEIYVQSQDLKLYHDKILISKNQGFMLNPKNQHVSIRFSMEVEFKNRTQYTELLTVYQNADWCNYCSDFFVFTLDEQGFIEKIRLEKNCDVINERKAFKEEFDV